MMKNIKMIVSIEKYMVEDGLNKNDTVDSLIEEMSNVKEHSEIVQNIKEHMINNGLIENDSIEHLVESIEEEDMKSFQK